MNRAQYYYTRWRPRVVVSLVAVVLCLLSGCWQKVHYEGPTGASSAEGPAHNSTPTAEFGRDAGAFGDDLVAALASQSAAPERSDTNVQPAVSVASNERAIAGERYQPTAAAEDAKRSDQGLLGADYRLGPTNMGTSSPSPAETAQMPVSTFPQAPPGIAGATGGKTVPPEPTRMNPTNPMRSIAQLPTTARPATENADQSAAAMSRRAAWQLGSKWSLAALARERGASFDNVTKWLEQANTLARFLGASLSQLPPPLSDREVSTRAMVRHLFAEGQRVGRQLAERYGPDHAALFELGVKSNLLLVLYEPKTPVAETLARSIAKARDEAGSPVELWQPLLDAMAEGREPAAVRQLVFRLHEEVDRSLAGPMEQ
jgi:hypothetical protein